MTDIERLIHQFGAQDVGAYMVAFVNGKHYKVATWVQEVQNWAVTDDGRALLGGNTTSGEIEEPPKRGRKPKQPADVIEFDEVE